MHINKFNSLDFSKNQIGLNILNTGKKMLKHDTCKLIVV